MQERDTVAGLAFSIGASVLWGIMPLYWRLLSGLSPIEVTVHRLVWCALTMGAIVLARRRLSYVREAFRSPRLLATLCLTATLIALNWGVYVWAVDAGQLVQASLGYYIYPLISVGLGVMLLGETMSGLRLAAVLLACAAVAVQTMALGQVSLISLTLAVTFGFYGYFRKIALVGAMEGVFIEAIILFPLMAGLVLSWGVAGTGALFERGPGTDFLLAMSGPMTAAPLVLFSAGVKRVRLSTAGLLSYLAPSITLVIATVFLGEEFTVINAASFGCVWVALILLGVEGSRRTRLSPVPRQKS